MANKKIVIEGMPSFVKIEENPKNGNQYAEVYIESENIRDIGEALIKLDALGFGNPWVTYNLGYYDSVERIRFELTKYKQ